VCFLQKIGCLWPWNACWQFLWPTAAFSVSVPDLYLHGAVLAWVLAMGLWLSHAGVELKQQHGSAWTGFLCTGFPQLMLQCILGKLCYLQKCWYFPLQHWTFGHSRNIHRCQAPYKQVTAPGHVTTVDKMSAVNCPPTVVSCWTHLASVYSVMVDWAWGSCGTQVPWDLADILVRLLYLHKYALEMCQSSNLCLILAGSFTSLVCTCMMSVYVQLQLENEQLYDELNSMVDEVR